MVLRCIKDNTLVKMEVKKVIFDPNLARWKEDYLDVFEGVKADIKYTAKYDENCDT